MTAIKKILKNANFTEWTSDEKHALCGMIVAMTRGRSNFSHIVGKSDRVWTTFVEILVARLNGGINHG